MYTVSESYKENIYSDTRTIRAYIQMDAHQFADDGELVSAKFSADTEEKAIIGQAISWQVEIECNVTKDSFAANFNPESDIVPYIGVETGETVEYIPYPPMHIASFEYDRDTGVLTMSCTDHMADADKYTVGDLPEMTYPLTVGDYLQAICDKIGVTKSTAAFWGSDFQLTEPPNFSGSETLRTALKHMAAMCLGNCYINKSGAVEIKCISDAVSAETVTGDYYYTAKVGDKIIGINTVILSRQPQQDIIYANDQERINIDGVSSIEIENNAFMDGHRETYAPLLLAKIKGLSFYPCEFEWRGNPALDPFDLMSVETVDGTIFTTFLFSEELNFAGGLRSRIQNNCNNKNAVSYAKGSTVKDKIKNAEIEVDKVKNIITSLVEEGGELRSLISQSASDILLQVQEQYATKDSLQENLTEIKQTADKIELSVQKNEQQLSDIQENGVQKVFNATGIFDKDGFSIGKSDSEFSSLLTELGLFLKSRGVDIAKFTNEGADIRNLTVSNEIIAAYLRIIKVDVNGEKRCHIHWIGE